jgi:hypothetical protein
MFDLLILQYRMNIDGYYRDANPTDNGLSPSRTSVLLANLCAFEFWQRTFKVSISLSFHDMFLVVCSTMHNVCITNTTGRIGFIPCEKLSISKVVPVNTTSSVGCLHMTGEM